MGRRWMGRTRAKTMVKQMSLDDSSVASSTGCNESYASFRKQKKLASSTGSRSNSHRGQQNEIRDQRHDEDQATEEFDAPYTMEDIMTASSSNPEFTISLSTDGKQHTIGTYSTRLRSSCNSFDDDRSQCSGFLALRQNDQLACDEDDDESTRVDQSISSDIVKTLEQEPKHYESFTSCTMASSTAYSSQENFLSGEDELESLVADDASSIDVSASNPVDSRSPSSELNSDSSPPRSPVRRVTPSPPSRTDSRGQPTSGLMSSSRASPPAIHAQSQHRESRNISAMSKVDGLTSSEDRQRRMSKFRPSGSSSTNPNLVRPSPRHQHSHVMAEMISSQSTLAHRRRVGFDASARNGGLRSPQLSSRSIVVTDVSNIGADLVEMSRSANGHLHHQMESHLRQAPPPASGYSFTPPNRSSSFTSRGRKPSSSRHSGEYIGNSSSSQRPARYDGRNMNALPVNYGETNEMAHRNKSRPSVTLHETHVRHQAVARRDHVAPRSSPRQRSRSSNYHDGSPHLPHRSRQMESDFGNAPRQTFRPSSMARAASPNRHAPRQMPRSFQALVEREEEMGISANGHSHYPNAMTEQRPGASFHYHDSQDDYPPRDGRSSHTPYGGIERHGAGAYIGGISSANTPRADGLSPEESLQLEEKMLKIAMERSLAEASTLAPVEQLPPPPPPPPPPIQYEHVLAARSPSSFQSPQPPHNDSRRTSDYGPPSRSLPQRSQSFQDYVGRDDSHDTDPETATRLAEIEQEREMLELAIQQSLNESFASIDTSFENSFSSLSALGGGPETTAPLTSAPSLLVPPNHGESWQYEEEEFDKQMQSPLPPPRTRYGEELQLSAHVPSTPVSSRGFSTEPSVVQVLSPPKVHPLEAATASTSSTKK